MLKPRYIEREEATNSWAAARDAQRRNSNGKSHFTPAQVARGFAMKHGLELCYEGTFYDPNYRAGRAPLHNSKFIAIKIEDHKIKDKKALKFLTDGWKLDPSIVVDPIETNQGITYRVYFT